MTEGTKCAILARAQNRAAVGLPFCGARGHSVNLHLYQNVYSLSCCSGPQFYITGGIGQDLS